MAVVAEEIQVQGDVEGAAVAGPPLALGGVEHSAAAFVMVLKSGGHPEGASGALVHPLMMVVADLPPSVGVLMLEGELAADFP